MKKINLLYLAIIPICYFLYQMNSTLGQSSAFFYGFAENKETDLSHDKAVSIEKILVEIGESVTKGQLLLEVKQSSIDYKIDVANLDLEEFKIKVEERKQELKNKIDQLKIERQTEIAEIEADIKSLEAVIAYNEGLLKDLKSFEHENIQPKDSPNQIKLKALRESRTLATDPIDTEIAQLQKELAAINASSAVSHEKIKGELAYYQDEQKQLSILAPSDGLIGNILCKEGENFQAFSTLLNFYERNPTIVKGFVHESLILQVNVGDSLLVSSTLHPELHVLGQVSGLGSRIVEIPERLRKIPEVKTYGREVMIRIPSDNPFLQKEKVVLNSLNENPENTFESFFSLLRAKTAVGDKKINNSFSTNPGDN
jgi:multidrug resistance efflux pump